ncbi:retrovirus-related pol polyprotein from transposon TNT 1-94 [Tanacetum coccineum]
MPLRVPIPLEVVAPKHVVTRVYTRRPKVPMFVQNSKPKVVKSMTANRMKLGTSRGFDTQFLHLILLLSTAASSSICLFSKATKIKSWLWHRRLSQLNFGAINHLVRHGLVRGLPRLKFEKGNLCYFLASKDEAPDFIIKFLKMIQIRLNATVRNIRTDNGTEFVNQTLRDYYEQVGISHETSVARTPQQNGVVERRNCTLVEAARTMLIYAKAHLFLWAEAVATACYTQNRSIIRRRHGKTPYELLHDRKPDLSYLHVFGALCYPNNDSENLGKLQAKADIGIFIGYAPKKKAYRIYNRRTQKIIETIHVDFDELTAMASEQSSLEPVLHEMTPATPSSVFIPNPPPSASLVPPSRHEWYLVFQPVFDKFFSPSASVASPVLVEEAPAPVESTGSPSLTTVYQDSPSPKESHDLEVAYMSNDPYFGIPIPETVSEESSSSDVIPTTVHSYAPLSKHLIKPKTYKDALTQSCWIKAMQEELHEFERLEV